MKILMIIYDLSVVGGVERVVANLSNAFTQANHEICIVSLFGFDKKDKNLPFIYDKNIKLYYLQNMQRKELELPKVSNIFLKLSRELLRPIVRSINFYIKKTKILELKSIIDKFNPDFIIDHPFDFNWREYFDENKKVIKVVHGNFDTYQNVKLKYKNIALLSAHDRDKFQAKYPNSNFYVIPNFLPSIADLNTNPAQKVVLSVGRLTDQKGFLRLIDIWNLVQNGGKFKDWKLKIVGDGELKEQIVAKIKELNLEDSIELKPFTTEVEKEYLSASIYAMSSHFEGFGMVLIEASACALPCIAFDVATGPRDIIDDGKSGYLVADNDLQEYANKLQILMSDENLRVQMGAKSKEIAKAKFSKEVVLKQWEEMFEKLKKSE